MIPNQQDVILTQLMWWLLQFGLCRPTFLYPRVLPAFQSQARLKSCTPALICAPLCRVAILHLGRRARASNSRTMTPRLRNRWALVSVGFKARRMICQPVSISPTTALSCLPVDAWVECFVKRRPREKAKAMLTLPSRLGLTPLRESQPQSLEPHL